MSLVVTSWLCNCDERILPCPVTTLPTPNTWSDPTYRGRVSSLNP